jgi:excisionase family DNA binding protein
MAKLLSILEFSEKLGIKPSTTRAWLWRRKIEFIRVGRCIRIRESEVDRLIEQGRVPAVGGAK